MVDSVQTQGEKFCWLFPKVVLNQTVKVNPPYLEKVFLFFGIVVLAFADALSYSSLSLIFSYVSLCSILDERSEVKLRHFSSPLLCASNLTIVGNLVFSMPMV